MKNKISIVFAVLTSVVWIMNSFASDIDNMTLEELKEAYTQLQSEKEDLEKEVLSLKDQVIDLQAEVNEGILLNEGTEDENQVETGTLFENDGKNAPVVQDKYTWLIKNYVGKNLASIGYTSLGGDRMEEYGNGHLKIILVTDDGSFLDPYDEDELKMYTVTDQNIAPDTVLKYVFDVDSDGNESEYSIASQNYDQIELCVKNTNGIIAETPVVAEMIQPNPSDKHKAFIRNYVGKNLSAIGYTSLGGDRMDEYGSARIKFVLIADDGSYIDPEDEDMLQKYVVSGQNIAPNTEMLIEYRIDDDGVESDYSISSQTIEEIELNVTKIDEAVLQAIEEKKASIIERWLSQEYTVVSLYVAETDTTTVISSGFGLTVHNNGSLVDVKDEKGEYWGQEFIEDEDKVITETFGSGRKNISIYRNGELVISDENLCIDGGTGLLNVHPLMDLHKYSEQVFLEDTDKITITVEDAE